MPEGWQWDETLYRGSAAYYALGRPPYAPGLADRLAEAVPLDGTGRLLDVGCGPGIVTLLLARLVAEGVGLDADAEMLGVAARRAESAGIGNIAWVHARAEDLPAGLGVFSLVTFAQSFHWMDQARVATVVRSMLEPSGAFVHISDVKEPSPDAKALPHPEPPYAAIRKLVQKYLGAVPRAGQGVLSLGTPDCEGVVLRNAGFQGPERIIVPATEPFIRDVEAVVAWVYSMSSSAPHLFAESRSEFEAELRTLLHDAAPGGQFADQPSDTEVVIWRMSRNFGVEPGSRY